MLSNLALPAIGVSKATAAAQPVGHFTGSSFLTTRMGLRTQRQTRGPPSMLSINVSSQRIRSRRVLAAILAVCVVAAGVYWVYRPLDPDAIAARAIDALGKHDAVGLIALADPEEVSRLHVTPAAIEDILSKTIWQEPTIRNASRTHMEQTPDDQYVWLVKWPTGGAGAIDLSVVAVDSQTVGWKLDLTCLLWAACWRHSDGPAGAREYIDLARKNGVSGIRQQAGNYVSLDKLDNSVKDIGY